MNETSGALDPESTPTRVVGLVADKRFVFAAGTSVLLVDAAIAARFHSSSALPALLCFGVIGTFLACIDVAVRRIPNVGLAIAYPIVIGLLVEASAVGGHWQNLPRAAIAAVVLGTFYLALGLWRPGEIGLGDCKLAPLVGLVLGWLAWSAVVEGALFGFLLAALWVLPSLASRRRSKSSLIAFGPFMIVGALGAALLV